MSQSEKFVLVLEAFAKIAWNFKIEIAVLLVSYAIWVVVSSRVRR